MKLLAVFAALGVLVAAVSALEHDWTHTVFGVTGCAAAFLIRIRMRRRAEAAEQSV